MAKKNAKKTSTASASRAVGHDVVLAALIRARDAAGSNAKLAAEVGCGATFVRYCLAGERPVSGPLLEYLGFELAPRTYHRTGEQ